MIRMNIDHPVVEKLVATMLLIQMSASKAPSHIPFVKAFAKHAEDAMAVYRDARAKVGLQNVRSAPELIKGLEDLVNAFGTASHHAKLHGSDVEAALYLKDQQSFTSIIKELKVHHGIP